MPSLLDLEILEDRRHQVRQIAVEINRRRISGRQAYGLSRCVDRIEAVPEPFDEDQSTATSEHPRHVARRTFLFLQIAEIDQHPDAQTRVVAGADLLWFEHRIMEEAVVCFAVRLTGPL